MIVFAHGSLISRPCVVIFRKPVGGYRYWSSSNSASADIGVGISFL